MTKEEIKAFKLKMEYYEKTLREALIFCDMLQQDFEKLINDEECLDQMKK